MREFLFFVALGVVETRNLTLPSLLESASRKMQDSRPLRNGGGAKCQTLCSSSLLELRHARPSSPLEWWNGKVHVSLCFVAFGAESRNMGLSSLLESWSREALVEAASMDALRMQRISHGIRTHSVSRSQWTTMEVVVSYCAGAGRKCRLCLVAHSNMLGNRKHVKLSLRLWSSLKRSGSAVALTVCLWTSDLD